MHTQRFLQRLVQPAEINVVGGRGEEGSGGMAMRGLAKGWRGEEGMGINPKPETKGASMMHHDVRWVDHCGEGNGKH